MHFYGESWRGLLAIFELEAMRLQFSLEAVDTIHLPDYKGSVFHGGFGHALQKISPTWFAYFFQPATEDGNQLPKPFALLPPLEDQQIYQPGDTFHCELTLFGKAARHYAIAQAAIEYLGAEMGLGYSRGKYKITAIDESVFTGSDLSPQTITLSLRTRLRLKADNRLLKQAPEFSLLMARLCGRLKTLQQTYGTEPIAEERYRELLQQADTIACFDSNVYWDEWDRYSGSQKEWMKFGGLLGQINYRGNLQPFIPALEMGEWTHIGGKSSFGLGKYSIDYGDSNAITST